MKCNGNFLEMHSSRNKNCLQAKLELKYVAEDDTNDVENEFVIECVITKVYLSDVEEMNKGLNIKIEVEEDEEIKMMNEMGLPTAFGNNIKNQSVNDEHEILESIEVSEEALNEEFNTYWSQNGHGIATEMWNNKYKDFMYQTPSNEIKHSEDVLLTNEIKNENVEKNDSYGDEWQRIWDEHINSVYENAKKTFMETNQREFEDTACMNSNSLDCDVDKSETNTVKSSTETKETISSGDAIISDDTILTDVEKYLKKLRKIITPSNNFKRKKFSLKSGVEGLKQVHQIASALNLSFDSDDSSSNGNTKIIEGAVKYCRKPLRLQVKDSPKHIRFDEEDDQLNGVQDDREVNHNYKNGVHPKYWAQRYRLFTKFDDGIMLDEECWYSVTPEKIAEHIAIKFKNLIVIDAFCGAGGNTIQLAKQCKKVIAIDIDSAKIKLAKHNAHVYEVDHLIDFVIGDYMKLASTLKAEAVFLSPPWGGPAYIGRKVFDITKMPIDGFRIMEATIGITSNIAFYLPRNTNLNQMNMLAKNAGRRVRIEQNMLNDKCKTITAYYGNLI